MTATIEEIQRGDCLPINEVFQTLQGEASFTGTPALFIRLQGCPVGCSFCDTKHTWDLRQADRIAVDDMLCKVDPAQSYALVAPEHLAGLVDSFQARHVVITGGEPCLFDLTEFCLSVERSGRTVQIETSGTAEVRVSPRAWVTLSPKIGMAGGLSVRRDAVRRANEIKMPVGRPADVEALLEFLAAHDVQASDRRLIWLQPLSRSPKATALCIEAATRLGFRVSVQMHAFIGVR